MSNSPKIYHQIKALQQDLLPSRATKTIALVPTMGNLHEGHLELVRIAKTRADIVVVSIFVNPTQFGVGEDFDSYPRTLDDDVAKLARVGADLVFAPSVDEMYPVMPPPTQVLTGDIAKLLCGQSRPTHFDGVGIVVCKLFNIIAPNIAIFGQKDYQQLAIIKQLVLDLSYPIEIIAAPIIRADDGLALSSRNQYLTADERKIAPKLQQELQNLAEQLKDNSSKKSLNELIDDSKTKLNQAGFLVDYLEIKSPTLAPIASEKASNVFQNDAPIVILVAAKLGRARLLDNLIVTQS
ncbi:MULTISPECIES: pantoate--beta-alanine ligase [Psychrobacter]|uniref:pantoate--beta-alanine ligase n=1 Tax=Psychrobacter TaxID=497 RepID=UPI00146E1D0C|nr:MULTISPECIES: pantoate--beta-alanine ligase [Psychrobacter]